LLTRIDAQAGNSSIVMFFDQTLETGDTVSGSISASFTAGALQNLDGTTFELDRGYLGGASMIQATGIGAVPVPEPASYAIWAGVLAIATTVIVRRRRPAAVLS
ncbi:MAG: hypothetical protein JSS11_09935, partial [Verrucomicrobia bacterium]|nr:hypothetical protein [Verrucomicrobiota bacterium]